MRGYKTNVFDLYGQPGNFISNQNRKNELLTLVIKLVLDHARNKHFGEQMALKQKFE